MKKNKEMDVIFILDKSGSMGGYESDTIGGYNSYLEKVKKNNSKVFVTTVLFNNTYEVLYEREDINKVKPLTNKDYVVGGSTALYDAIGKTLERVDKNHKVLFVITTDGLENASREYTKDNIKRMIKQNENIEFIYLGADIDSYKEGASIGIKQSGIANFSKSKKGLNRMFDAVCAATMELEDSESLSGRWKSNLDSFIETEISKK